MKYCVICNRPYPKLRYRFKCKSCWKKENYTLNRSSILKQKREYHDKNKDTINCNKRQKRKTSPNIKAADRLKYLKYKNMYVLNATNRRISRLKAMPVWVDFKMKKEIKDFYTLAKELQWLSDEKLHVDHIVPLKGKNVCGLHVPWNLQIITASENIKKSNNLEPHLRQ